MAYNNLSFLAPPPNHPSQQAQLNAALTPYNYALRQLQQQHAQAPGQIAQGEHDYMGGILHNSQDWNAEARHARGANSRAYGQVRMEQHGDLSGVQHDLGAQGASAAPVNAYAHQNGQALGTLQQALQGWVGTQQASQRRDYSDYRKLGYATSQAGRTTLETTYQQALAKLLLDRAQTEWTTRGQIGMFN